MKTLRFIAIAAASLIVSFGVYAQSSEVKVAPGIDVLEQRGFDCLRGKRVGLLTNPTGITSDVRSTIDVLNNAPEVNLVALFAPEHGVRGDLYAGKHAADTIDARTGVPVYSLYGSHRQPTKEMFSQIDVLVYDIQDIGVRSYTFISCLGLAMRTAAETGVKVVVLDRPNPLGGLKVEGNYVEKGYYSYVSQYPIPYVYGLTVGEVALMINSEGMNRGQKGDLKPLVCDLEVVPMKGWTRDMLFSDTGLPWVQTSPNIPTAMSAVHCASSGIIGDVSGFLNIGIGYTLPFAVFGASWIDAAELKARLDSYNLPGVAFKEVYFVPMAGKDQGVLQKGVQYYYTDYDAATITMTGFYVMQAVCELYPDHNPYVNPDAKVRYDKVCGTGYLSSVLSKTMKISLVEGYWAKDVENFKALSSKYYLYK